MIFPGPGALLSKLFVTIAPRRPIVDCGAFANAKEAAWILVWTCDVQITPETDAESSLTVMRHPAWNKLTNR
ncbi:hypothetical protein [Bradyrhizobium sp. USDA 4353]